VFPSDKKVPRAEKTEPFVRLELRMTNFSPRVLYVRFRTQSQYYRPALGKRSSRENNTGSQEKGTRCLAMRDAIWPYRGRESLAAISL
jgi:hypothetical protein